jgi:hypothetical protein
MIADARPRARRARIIDVVGSLRPPVSSGRFWLVQAGVLGVAIFHEIVLDLMGVTCRSGSGSDHRAAAHPGHLRGTELRCPCGGNHGRPRS